MRLSTRKTVIAALLGVWGLPALAQTMPLSVKPGHPRLFADSASFVRVQEQLPLGPALFPAEGGSIELEITPKNVKGANDLLDRGVFGIYDTKRNTIVIRHVDSYDTADAAGYQVILQRKDGVYVMATKLMLPAGVPAKIKLDWNSKTYFVDLHVNGVRVSTGWGRDGENGPRYEWRADEQRFSLSSRIGEDVRNVVLRDASGKVVSEYAKDGKIDLPSSTAYADFLAATRNMKAILAACPTTATPVREKGKEVCDVSTGHRIMVYETAQRLALAYRLSGDKGFLDGALNYIDKMAIVPLRDGNAYTMGGRVGAMGILYDWLFKEMGENRPAGDAAAPSYRNLLAQKIKATIAATSAKRIDDLDSTTCGDHQKNPLDVTKPIFNCDVAPLIKDYDQIANATVPSIAWGYIGGMPFSGVNITALALLAIAEEHGEVLPLIETAYKHFDQGFLKARSIISVDGGNHTGYAYGMANIPERVLMWRSALAPASPPVFNAPWQAELIYPYVYGLRGDGTFPTAGDAFDITPGDAMIGNSALWAASNANDGNALNFYKEQVLTRPRAPAHTILERLMYPLATTDAPETLPLSRHFRKAGQVLMRDTWNYPDATLLEFKSASLWSENHQHLEQNGLTLFYKAPLLVDSGLYDSYGGSHWSNYYTRTIAHNTVIVFDPNERFMHGTIEYSNDGGQWYQNPNTRYPTIEQIGENKSNHIKGVTHFEHTPSHTFTVGDASKAYSKDKMKQDGGFVRSVLFLPDVSFWNNKPITIVFDAVRTERNLPATFLLHTANEPAAAADATLSYNGRYQFAFADAASRALTIRNGDGMLTAQTLLPVNATVLKVGGDGKAGANCIQSGAGVPIVSGGDCRFTVRERRPDGQPFLWRNFAIGESSNNIRTDVGAWRLEVSPPAAPVNGAAQYFLNVLGVADNDGDDGAAPAPAAKLLVGDTNTAAILLGADMVVSFNRDNTAASTVGWTAPVANPSIIATGLTPGKDFALTTVAAGGAYKMTLKEATTGSPLYRSSAAGVVRVR